ncbi:hypothetical protein SLEP1_g49367 [Rubroshorea leprosula]|uniref:Uncharacterized protein n=1 Tax=Rubroshorea leprosula TaxID=152421 RepID=A0AAV5LXV5_9ROSI|nr:hypothetical protein SLEP1_g49367 [Rubroshorea leprosula]
MSRSGRCILLKGLEKIVASEEIPMLCSACTFCHGKDRPNALDLVVDPLGILCPHGKLAHQLPLVSAYSSLARVGVGLELEQQRRRTDPSTNEPFFTSCTRDFIGTLDYIFYTSEFLCI